VSTEKDFPAENVSVSQAWKRLNATDNIHTWEGLLEPEIPLTTKEKWNKRRKKLNLKTKYKIQRSDTSTELELKL